MIVNKKKLSVTVSVILGIITVMVIGAILLVRMTVQPLNLDRPKAASQAAVLKSERYSISYNNNGTFEPESLTVKVGDQITFKNNSSEGMEIAIGEHESHLLLKGFEEKEVKSQEFYIFSPRERGSFIFHNHLKPQKSGKLVIE